MKPWREVVVPHLDVLGGTFQQSEFAADITAVRKRQASHDYQDASAFFERTFITEGMRLLLTQVAQRLNGNGGEPVIQLQTAFGGGKTHTMLSVYHLATRECSLNELAGIPEVLDRAGIMDVPRARVAILDGSDHGPGQPWKRGDTVIRTLWGELAWQLGGLEGYEMVATSDETGSSPGKQVLQALLVRYAPCIILVDELVAYVRQFADGQKMSGGTFDSNLSFAQALTEAVKPVPNAILLASLPESEVEAGSSRGVIALRALEHTFKRVQALWKPVATEEAFEIVRRRLFQPIADLTARDTVCRAFADLYASEGARLPSETHEARYLDRLISAYPIHPEVFDRLYEDWSALETFQRTRGLLKLMAHVIHELWVKGNSDQLILPSSLPLYRGKTRDELLSHLPPGWDPVLDRDVDEDRSESAELDQRETRFGAVQAARRVARTTFLGSAPSSAGPRNLTRGVDRARILLGCLQPGQTSSLFSDALNRLADRLHYLNASGDKNSDNTCFWFDTRANLRREMEDRKGRFDERSEVRKKIGDVMATLAPERDYFMVHPFTPHADVTDDALLRLIILDPTQAYSKQSPQSATEALVTYVQTNGSRSRLRGNRLVFLAPDSGSVGRLRDAVRTALAWSSIVRDIHDKRLVTDQLQGDQATKELKLAESVAQRAARDCFRWLLCPGVQTATDREIVIEAFQLNNSAPSLLAEARRVCEENELVISKWSPIHLRDRLREFYWKDGRTAVRAMTVWEDMQRHLYLPRLRGLDVYEQTIFAGAASDDFFGVALGQSGDKLEGFSLGAPILQIDGSVLLIEPEAARSHRNRAKPQPTAATDVPTSPPTPPLRSSGASLPAVKSTPADTRYFATIEVSAATAKMSLITIADEIIGVLDADPNGSVHVSVEIAADFPQGVPEQLKRAVEDNAAQLKLRFRNKHWE